MYGTGKIGFWSLLETGIGIVAGSLPALRPLLSLRVTVSSTYNTRKLTIGESSGRSEPAIKPSRHAHSRSSVLALDTFHELGDRDDHHESDDADSQKNIVKETKYEVTSSRAANCKDECKRHQVLGWEQS